MVYLDSSALVKLVIRERETTSLRRYLRSQPSRFASSISRTEVPRAVRDRGSAALKRARAILDGVHLIRVDDVLLDAAGALDARVLRSLDAIHLAAAQTLGAGLVAVVTYDSRMLVAAKHLGLTVVTPV
jgi:hypothetical protein